MLAALAVSVRLMGVAVGAGRAGHNGGCRKRILSVVVGCVLTTSLVFSVLLVFLVLGWDRYLDLMAATAGHRFVRPVVELPSGPGPPGPEPEPELRSSSWELFKRLARASSAGVMSSISSPSKTSLPNIPSLFSSRSRASILSTHSHTITLAAAAPTHLT